MRHTPRKLNLTVVPARRTPVWAALLALVIAVNGCATGQVDKKKGYMKIEAKYTVDGQPILGSYTCTKLEDLALGKKIGLNIIIGDREHLDVATPEGKFIAENGMKVLYHLTHHIYGMPRLGAAITADQTEIPLSKREHRAIHEPGIVQIEDELVRYDKYTPEALLGCERGADGTTPAEHHQGIFLFDPEECAEDVESVKDSPNLWGYYVLDDSPGDCISALRAMYKTIWRVDGGPNHHRVCAGYGSPGSVINFGPGVCDVMMVYWYPISDNGYRQGWISHETQWLLTAARDRVPGIPFVGVYQAFWGDGAGTEPIPPHLIREQMEDFVREGASGLIAFACASSKVAPGWAANKPMQQAMKEVHEEIISTGGLQLAPEPEKMKRERIQPTGFWRTPNKIPGIIPAWHMVGPFDAPSGAPLTGVFPPEKTIDLNAVYDGKVEPIRWIKRNSQAGAVGLIELFGTPNAVAYATCTVTSPVEQEVQMRIGTDDDGVVWINGKEVYRHEGTRGLARDNDVVPVVLPAGDSQILVKVGNRLGMWAFFLRFTDLNGDPLTGLTFSPQSD